jgi:molecular chaperone DnaK (HSP70)
MENEYPQFQLSNKELVSPEAAEAVLLGELLQSVQLECGEKVNHVCISYPGVKEPNCCLCNAAYFSFTAKEATRRIGELCGIPRNQITLVPEPGIVKHPCVLIPIGAAALYYWVTNYDQLMSKMKEKKADVLYLLVGDFGGGTADTCFVSLSKTAVMTITTRGSNILGGEDIDRMIADKSKQIICLQFVMISMRENLQRY